MMHALQEQREQHLLLGSALATLAISLSGLGVGIWSGAKAIVFDGMFDAIGAGMTLLAWQIARLMASGRDQHFQFGYWHLEPLLALISGSLTLSTCVYGFLNGLGSFLGGGRIVDYDVAIWYAAITAIASFTAFAHLRFLGRGLDSNLLQSDARSWLFGGMVSGGLCLSFGLARLAAAAHVDVVAPLVDPLVLMSLTVVMMPFPLLTLYRAGKDMLQIAPSELDQRATATAQQVCARHGFVAHASHVTRLGRAQFVEIGFVAASPQVTVSFEELDAIREEVTLALGGLCPRNWVTVSFTASRRWISHDQHDFTADQLRPQSP
jgi:predicted Co/Zn/Cd cation transporter (cation efflux family)